MPARRRKVRTEPPVAASGELTAAFERQKQLFLTRNAERCPYLLVQLQPDAAAHRLVIIANFAFTEDRAWQQVDTHIPTAALTVEAGPEPRFAEAFARLEDGIGAARIARLFSPLSVAQRLPGGGRPA